MCSLTLTTYLEMLETYNRKMLSENITGIEVDLEDDFASSFNGPEIFFFILVGFLLVGVLSWFLLGLKDFMQERLEEINKKKRDNELSGAEVFEPVDNSENVEDDNEQTMNGTGGYETERKLEPVSGFKNINIERNLRSDNPMLSQGSSKSFGSTTLSSSGMFEKSTLLSGKTKVQPLPKRVLEVSSSSRIVETPSSMSLSTPLSLGDDFARDLSRLPSATGKSWKDIISSERKNSFSAGEEKWRFTNKNSLITNVPIPHARNNTLPPLKRILPDSHISTQHI